MSQYAGQHVGPSTPTSLNGASTFTITLPKGVSKVVVQPNLITTATLVVHFRVAYATALTATALTTAERTLANRQPAEVNLDPTKQAYLYVLTTNAAGAATNGGAADRLNIYAEGD